VSNNATIFEGSNEVGQDVEGLFPECECFTSRIHALASRDERVFDLMMVYCVLSAQVVLCAKARK
jgi:hypothetical protein